MASARLSLSEKITAKRSVFFGSLPESLFECIVTQSHVVGLDAGQILFHQGERSSSVFAVLDGLIKLSVTSRDGEDVVVEIFETGASFAEALLFQDAPYPVTATALLPSRILSAPSSVVLSEIESTPDAFPAILASTYRHLHKLVQQIEQLKSNTGLERVASYLLALSATASADGRIDLPFEKQVLASLLGVKPETLSRTFRRLEQHGVRLDGRQILIEDKDAFLAFASKS